MKKGVIVIVLLAIVGYLAREKVMELGVVKRFLKKVPKAVQPDAPPPAVPVVSERKGPVEKKPAPAPPVKVSDSAAAIATGASAPELDAPPKETLGEIEQMLAGGNKAEAWGKLTRKLLTCQSDAERDAVKNALAKLNKDMFFSKNSEEGAEFYVVQAGDSLYSIAKKFGAPEGLIMWASNKPNDKIRSGERLKIPKGRVKLLVDKSDFRLYVLLNNCYLKDYPVGLGKQGGTPVGTFIVKNKIENPPWYAPDGHQYPFGDEKNILGSRWIGFEETAKYSGYGIHGTSMPERVGKAESAGCICMHNQEVEDLFRAVPRGTEVIIRD